MGAEVGGGVGAGGVSGVESSSGERTDLNKRIDKFDFCTSVWRGKPRSCISIRFFLRIFDPQLCVQSSGTTNKIQIN